MKKAIPTIKNDELEKGKTPLVFIPYGIYPSDFGTQLHVSIANLGVGGCLIRMQNVLEDDEGISIQSDNTVMSLNLHLVESDKDHKLYLYDDMKTGTKNIAAMLEDGSAWYDELPDLDDKPDIEGEETQENEYEEEEKEYNVEDAVSKIDNMNFDNEDESDDEEEEEDTDLLATLDNTPEDDEAEPEDSSVEPENQEEESDKEMTAGDIAEKLREAGLRAEVKDTDKQITYVNAPESKPYAKKPYHGDDNKRDKKKNKYDRRNDRREQRQQAVPMNRDIDFGAIAGSMFK